MSDSEKKIPVSIEGQMKYSYLSYAMSVIIGRALPDVRDGLKPVHRRILYAMYELRNFHNSPYKKSARIVGDVIGKYHPHGDMAVYDALVRMAQDFNMRYPLVDGQGNFGSIDGDPPAAMRYTEVRLKKLASLMLADIEKDTVDFVPNYDESTKEPVVLPAKIPNLLINGSSGIAVGMATNIPPHNLNEVIDATIHLIDNPGADINDIIRILKGPDFPTGAIIYGVEGIYDAYTTGKGLIKIRAKAHFEELKKGKHQAIVFDEIPYQTNKARTIEKIADLVKQKKIEEIQNLRDESDKDGLRIVIELKKGAQPEIVLNKLYAMTPLQITFGINFLAIVNGQPKLLNIKEILNAFINHRRDVVIRRTKFDLNKALARAHIVEGLLKALDVIDEIIALIRASSSPDEAKKGLIDQFDFTEIQATEILNMRLQKLTALEREKLVEEYEQLMKLIKWLKSILESNAVLMDVIKKELIEIKEKFGDARKTEIVKKSAELSIEDLIEDKEVVVTITGKGYVKRIPLEIYRTQRKGGKGKKGHDTVKDDVVLDIFIAKNHDKIILFSDKGKMYYLKVYEIPEGSRTSKGRPVINLLPISKDERITAILPEKKILNNKYVVMITRRGFLKKSLADYYANFKINGTTAIKIKPDDELIDVSLINDEDEIIIVTKEGMAIRFESNTVRPIGRVASGVIGIRLNKNDAVCGMIIVKPENRDADLLTVTEKGYGKRTPIASYRVQSRGGKGVKTMRITPKNGRIVDVKKVTDDDELMIISSHGKIIRIAIKEISVMGRVTQGIKLINLDEGETVVGIEYLKNHKEEQEELPLD